MTMAKRIALIGDKTTTGGTIITGESQMKFDGKEVAMLGDKVSCPACKSIGVITEGTDKMNFKGKPAAYDGCIVACGCPTGTNRIIATQSLVSIEVS